MHSCCDGVCSGAGDSESICSVVGESVGPVVGDGVRSVVVERFGFICGVRYGVGSVVRESGALQLVVMKLVVLLVLELVQLVKYQGISR